MSVIDAIQRTLEELRVEVDRLRGDVAELGHQVAEVTTARSTSSSTGTSATRATKAENAKATS